uniref:Uncharacterized protein n=1 Tax=Odontella aurita TaxID=265563 RepID=A0A7S4I8M5_9STRA|mmetsp:Transcript_21253/g.61860  ORF Transcript_21253/g.61860 Transcript_21253/m.61860 type:complete len:192 (+) Transcript_21253:117-692(+)
MGESSSSIIERIADAASHYIWNCGGAKGSAAATMGNSGSSSSSKGAGVGSVLTKDELRRLGDRYPFSDDELIRLARCHALVAVGTSTGLPLLSAACRAYAYDDGAGGKSAGGTNGSSSLRRPAIVDVEALESSAEACERVILPPDFGLDLERAGFGIRPPPRANNPHDHDDDDGGRERHDIRSLRAGELRP